MNGINTLKNHYERLTLINRKTGKVSSTHHWFLALGTHSYLLNHKEGIASLLPLAKAHKTIKHNFLTLKKKRPGKNGTNRDFARQEAEKILPQLAMLYRSNLKSYQKFLKRKFCLWIKIEINTPHAKAHQLATSMGLSYLAEGNHSVRWWMDQLKKMQS
jgi:hypothetical protein